MNQVVLYLTYVKKMIEAPSYGNWSEILERSHSTSKQLSMVNYVVPYCDPFQMHLRFIFLHSNGI